MSSITRYLSKLRSAVKKLFGGCSKDLEAKLKIKIIAVLLLATTSQANADCMADIKSVMDAHMSAGPYHVSMTMNMGAKTMTNETDVILPSSFHMKSDKMETIMLKSGTWMKMNGKWTSMPQMSGMVQSMVSQGMAQGMKNVKNLQCLGSQTYQGAAFNTFSFDSSGEAMGIKSSSHITMYADDSNRPAWMEIDGKAMGKPSKIVQHITFDPSVTINPPK